jgi:hypothetical protein
VRREQEGGNGEGEVEVEGLTQRMDTEGEAVAA